jgi:hypothetical protein
MEQMNRTRGRAPFRDLGHPLPQLRTPCPKLGQYPAAGSLDFLEQHRIEIGRPRVGCIDGGPHLHAAP